MNEADQSDSQVEKFAPNGGTVISVVAGVVAAAFLVAWVVDTDEVPLWVPAVALLGAYVVYLSTVRPRVRVEKRELVLRNMLSTVRLPLAAVEEVAVQQVMAVRAGGKRYVCAGVGRTMRQAMKGSAMQKAREQAGGLRGEIAKAQVREQGMNYADFVEIRVQELINEDRMRRGIARFSPEADELATQVRRTWAKPEIAVLVAAVAFFVVGLLVG